MYFFHHLDYSRGTESAKFSPPSQKSTRWETVWASGQEARAELFSATPKSVHSTVPINADYRKLFVLYFLLLFMFEITEKTLKNSKNKEKINTDQ